MVCVYNTKHRRTAHRFDVWYPITWFDSIIMHAKRNERGEILVCRCGQISPKSCKL